MDPPTTTTTPLTNYKHLAAEQINHSRPWVIVQIHAKSFRVKWWSGKHLTPLLSLQANVALPLSFSLSLSVSVFMVFSCFLVPQGPGLRTALCLELSSHKLLFSMMRRNDSMVSLQWNFLHNIATEDLLQCSGTNSCPSVVVNRNVSPWWGSVSTI